MRIVVFFAAAWILVAIPVYRAVRVACRVSGRRPWLVVGALATLGLVGALAPGIGHLRPPWSESPSGLFLIGARLLGLGALAVGALAALAAVATAGLPRGG